MATDRPADPLEDQIAATLAAWDNPENEEAQQTYEELARRILALVLERRHHLFGEGE